MISFLQWIYLALGVLLLPLLMGIIPSKKNTDIKIIWATGFLCEWAVVFVCFLPAIIKGKPLHVPALMSLYICAFLGLIGLVISIVEKRFKPTSFGEKKLPSKSEIIYLGIFLAIVLFQLYKTIFFAYEDGDDAFYVATSQAAASTDTMYKIDAYLGIEIDVNFRYALAPFPMWIASISYLTKVDAAIVSHTILPPVLILVTYAIYVEIAKLLYEDDRKKRYIFLMLLSIFFMFENVSTSTQGTFLLTRARQGKEALANVILPFLFLTGFKIIKENCEVKFRDWLILIITCTAAALTSLLGNILAPLMVLALIIYMFVKKQSFLKILAIGSSAIPCALAVLLYIKY